MDAQERIRRFLKDPTTETFNIIKDCPICLSITYKRDNYILSKFISFNDFEEWLSSSFNRSLNVPSETNNDFDEKLAIYKLSSDELKRRTLKELSELANSFQEWKVIYYCCHSSDALEKKALQKMAQLAKSFDDWKLIYNNSLGDGELRRLALVKMDELFID